MSFLFMNFSHDAHRQTRYLSQSIRLREGASPGIIKATIMICSASVVAFLVWAAMTQVSEIARAPGEILPAGKNQIVQHLEGGTLAKLNVREGQHVRQDDLLMTLEDSESRQDLARATAQRAIFAIEEERLRALIENRPPVFDKELQKTQPDLIRDAKAFLDSRQQSAVSDLKVINAQISQKRDQLRTLQSELASAERNRALSEDLLNKRRHLHAQGLLSSVRLMETERQRNDLSGSVSALQGQIAEARSGIAEFASRKTALERGQESDARGELNRLLADRQQNEALMVKLQDRLSRLKVRAPVTGTVQGLAVNTLGASVAAGQQLLEIVPDSKDLIVNLRITPRHVGHLEPGQRVQVKISSFDFARYGSIDGTLMSLSPSTFAGEDGERYYEGRVSLAKDYVGNIDNILRPGMTVMADIITGRKTILAYLLKPLQSALATSFSER